MTYGSGGNPPSTEAGSDMTVNSVRPKDDSTELAPFSEGGASGSREGRAEGGGEPEFISDDHDHDEDGAICFDNPG